MGDNGYYLGEHGVGDKRTAYDESIRIPYLLRFPSKVKAGVRDELVLNLDIPATVLGAAGLKPPWVHYGANLIGLVTAEPGAVPWRRSFLYQNYRDPAYPKVTFDVLAVRSASHKYVENDHNPEWTQLFDLTADPGENLNLAKEPAAAVLLARMKGELEKLKQETAFRPPPPAALPGAR